MTKGFYAAERPRHALKGRELADPIPGTARVRLRDWAQKAQSDV